MSVSFRSFGIRPKCVADPAMALPMVSEHLRTAPPMFRVFWGVSTTCCVVVLGLTLPMIIRILVEGEKLRKMKRFVFLPAHVRLTVQILLLFPLLSVLSWISLIIIRQSVLCELLAYLYNMAVLFWFFELVITYLGGYERALYILQREPPWHVMRVPPLCCLNFCAQRRQFTEYDLRVTRFLIFQYAVIGPLIAVADSLNESYLNILHYLRVCVTMLCMWGLVTIYRGSCRVLASFKLGWKYVIIQATVILTNFTTIIAALLVEGYDDIYTADVMAEAWVNVIFSFMMVPLTIIAVFAYPPKDMYLREDFVNGVTRHLQTSPTDFDFCLGGHAAISELEDLEAATATSHEMSSECNEPVICSRKKVKTPKVKTPPADIQVFKGQESDSPDGSTPPGRAARETQSAARVECAAEFNGEVLAISRSATHLSSLPMPLDQVSADDTEGHAANDEGGGTPGACSVEDPLSSTSTRKALTRKVGGSFPLDTTPEALVAGSPNLPNAARKRSHSVRCLTPSPRFLNKTPLSYPFQRPSRAIFRVSVTPEEHSYHRATSPSSRSNVSH